MDYSFHTQGPGTEHCFIANSHLNNSPINITIHGTNLHGGFLHRLKLAWRLLTGRLGLVTEYDLLIEHCSFVGQNDGPPAVVVVN
jgi:hypothetical protein